MCNPTSFNCWNRIKKEARKSLRNNKLLVLFTAAREQLRIWMFFDNRIIVYFFIEMLGFLGMILDWL